VEILDATLDGEEAGRGDRTGLAAVAAALRKAGGFDRP
jgi:hypothetical protein